MPTGIYQHKPRTEETRRKISEAHRGKYIMENADGYKDLYGKSPRT